ncbi:hypothetical protein COLO4_22927 [Corchorus olitorius]|uniref:Uncharacterized protein n=1 Tax=Corchorus olitorius TaxID=93759 RepID=A0A1R3IIZ6_9ROSI|nr:hypothetical protein COLO4_22927 [Corchorus olitorius]
MQHVLCISLENSPQTSWVCIGITRFTSKAHIAHVVLESMCFQVKDVLDSMHKDAGEMGEKKNDKGANLLPHQM